jgi:hypothetical protein
MMTSTHETPWDRTPVVGINQVLGFVTLRLNTQGEFEELAQVPSKETLVCHHPNIDVIIHRNNIPELETWLMRYRATVVR